MKHAWAAADVRDAAEITAQKFVYQFIFRRALLGYHVRYEQMIEPPSPIAM